MATRLFYATTSQLWHAASWFSNKVLIHLCHWSSFQTWPQIWQKVPGVITDHKLVHKLVPVCFIMEPLRSSLPGKVLAEARSGMISLVTSSSCTQYAVVIRTWCYTWRLLKGPKILCFPQVPTWLATRDNLHHDICFSTLSMLHCLWRSSSLLGTWRVQH